MIATTLINEDVHVLWSTEAREDTLVVEVGDDGFVLTQTKDIIFLSNEQINFLIKLARAQKKKNGVKSKSN